MNIEDARHGKPQALPEPDSTNEGLHWNQILDWLSERLDDAKIQEMERSRLLQQLGIARNAPRPAGNEVYQVMTNEMLRLEVMTKDQLAEMVDKLHSDLRASERAQG